MTQRHPFVVAILLASLAFSVAADVATPGVDPSLTSLGGATSVTWPVAALAMAYLLRDWKPSVTVVVRNEGGPKDASKAP